MMAAAAELVFIPALGMGHLAATVEMAKRLIGRDHCLSITVLIMKTPFDKSKVISTTQSLLLKDAKDRTRTPSWNLEVPVFVNPVPAKVLPSSVLHKERGSAFILGVSKRLRLTKGIMVNTFEELESYVVKRLAKDAKVPPIYPVGPVLHLVKDEEEEDEEVIQIMRWLDDQPTSSVVFLCFGSMGSFDGEQVNQSIT
ncbi:hypothetical protein RHMOL_Rhmol04G0116600 [Rhododendron molle]|uniref:Uncharacterized protein n=1 Tax=Rhododendron molle TaxID=49168 RepID=A0ACC0NZ93_RHOML|nr:hypothetical protein RHMOL_Rhmol04G0116600 [Rhododendron molle]